MDYMMIKHKIEIKITSCSSVVVDYLSRINGSISDLEG